MAEFHVGDKVSCSADYTYDGKTHLASFVKTTTYTIIQVGGRNLPDDRIVIGINGVVTAAVNANTLSLISCVNGDKPGSTPITPDSDTSDIQDTTQEYNETAMTSEGIEEAMSEFLKAGNTKDMLKYNMRLYGVPHQFSPYADYRTYSITSDKSKDYCIGRKFIEHVFLEAPVVTIIPGKPLYLPAAKDEKGVTYGILTAASGNIAPLFTSLKAEKMNEMLRYYDFQSDYFKYMEYVNILCASAAAFLDIAQYQIPYSGLPMTKYKWQNYRWNDDGYKMASVNAMQNLGTVATGFIDYVKSMGSGILDAFDNFISGNGADAIVDAFTDSVDYSQYISALESVLTNCNFVQFYVDPRSGYSESGNNQTTQSKIAAAIDSGQEMMKELAFVVNSGGIDSEAMHELLSGAPEALTSFITDHSSGAIGGILSRLGSVTTNVLKGDNMIWPEIYTSSGYSKSYSLTVDLIAPYGNRLSYYLNILVPLFHILCLAIPKQSTANTYSSPFLVKCFFPGVFSCNLGIVESIQIDKNPDGDAWSVDGFPTHMKVTMNIKDLYSDLSITPTGDVLLFLANSSLVEYIATNCGINMVTPQLDMRIKLVSSVASAAISSIPGNIENAIFGGLEDLINSMAGV